MWDVGYAMWDLWINTTRIAHLRSHISHPALIDFGFINTVISVVQWLC